ncbi:hypothetical protein [Demetria terragena]|uniref:hypothetical protein n=1 Tax=Demetria terragena TaxID=63959 RepID=UPI00036ED687|nr:hypothetical protein [Demetria terragena]
MTRRWIVLTALAAATFFVASLGLSWILARPPHQAIKPAGPIVMITMPTLTWDDVSAKRTPHLWKLSQNGAVGNLVTRTTSGHSCSDNAWTSVSAGTRTSIGKSPPETPPGEPVGSCGKTAAPIVYDTNRAWLSGWQGWAENVEDKGFKARIGLLAASQEKKGRCVAGVGGMAAYGAADRDGEIDPFYPNVKDADFDACPITLVNLGSTQDSALGTLLDKLPDDATLVVSGHADDATRERLRTVIISGPDVEEGLLRSTKTRQPGLLQGTDLTALLMQGAAAPPKRAPYEAREPVVQPETDMVSAVKHVRGISVALRDEHRLVPPFFYTYTTLALLAIVGGLVLLRRSPRQGRRFFAAFGAWAASVPVSTFLIGLAPWWQASRPGVALIGGVLLTAVAIAAIALTGPWRRWIAGPAVLIATTTAVVIALDVTHSSRLQLISLMGLQPVYGGRYFGMGNVAYALYASCALLVTALLAGRWIQRGQPRLAAATVVVMGCCTLIIDGHPSWGADAGGPLALLPAFGYLALNAGGLRVTWQRILAVGGGAFVVVGGLAYLDYLRPPAYRTHIGNFVAGFVESGSTSALERNIQLNLKMLTSQWINLLVPVMLALTMYALMRPESRLGRPLRRLTSRVRFLGHGLAAVTICWLIGFGANDSGTAIPPSGMIVMLPLVILIAASKGRYAPRDAPVTAGSVLEPSAGGPRP